MPLSLGEDVFGKEFAKAFIKASSMFLLPDDSMIFTGRVPHRNIQKYVADADICVAPFVDGYSPMKVYEYLASMKPTIVTGNTDVGDMLEENQAGIATNTGNPRIFAESIISILDDSSKSQYLAHNGYELVKSQFTWKSIAQSMNKSIVRI